MAFAAPIPKIIAATAVPIPPWRRNVVHRAAVAL